jgi:hypothetical protein
LKKAGFSFWKESIPAIGKGYLDGGLIGASKSSIEEMLKIITRVLDEKLEKRRLPEIAYAMRLSKVLNAQQI